MAFSILFIVLVALPLELKAQSCKELQNELFATEHNYQKSTLNKCDENSQNRYCCKSNNPLSCKSIFQAQLDYDSALAKVNMLEGLIATSRAVENHHEAMRKVSAAELQAIDHQINNFLKSFQQANLLSHSLEADDGKYLWEDYQGDSPAYTKVFLDRKCSEKSFKTFCDKLNEQSKNQDAEDLYAMLHGFAQADYRIGYQPQVRAEHYKNYQEYLKFKGSNDESFMPLDEMNKSGDIKAVLDLQKVVNEHKANPTPELATKILEKSHKLRQIQMNYNQVVTINDGGVFDKFAKDQFEKKLLDTTVVSNVLSGNQNTIQNSKALDERMQTQIKNKSEIQKHNFQKQFAAKIGGRCSNPEKEDINKCLIKICQVQNLNETCKQEGNQELFSLGLEEFYRNQQKLNNAQILASGNQAIINCFNKSNMSDQKICMQEIHDSLGPLVTNNLAEAKNELELAQKTLDFLHQGEPVKQNLAKKYMSIKALKAKNCLNNQQEKRLSEMNSYCDTPQINTHALTALSLTSDLGNILLQYDKMEYENFLKGQGIFIADQSEQNYYDKMLADCKKNANSSGMCRHFINEEINQKENEKKRAEIIRMHEEAQNITRERRNIDDEGDYDDGPSGFSYALGGLTTGLVKNMPGIFQYMQNNRTHNRQMQMWDQQLKMHQLYYGAGATHHTYNVQVNYNDWYANQNAFNPTGTTYLNPYNNFTINNFAPASYTMNDGAIYLPAGAGSNNTSPQGFNFGP